MICTTLTFIVLLSAGEHKALPYNMRFQIHSQSPIFAITVSYVMVDFKFTAITQNYQLVGAGLVPARIMQSKIIK